MRKRRNVIVEDARACRSSLCKEQGDDKGQAADRVDDSPHADTPVPGRAGEDRGSDVTGYPGVDLKNGMSEAQDKRTFDLQ